MMLSMFSLVDRKDGTKTNGIPQSGVVLTSDNVGSMVVVWPDGSIVIENIDDITVQMPNLHEEEDEEKGTVLSLVKSEDETTH